ncbi:MerR family DNA-binding protein [Specibacter cremeus]|uniref:MerR family DNA-binding protein n=1 Tax=Specibacter cremeus TaxID=1629051 RepID=UPI0013DE660E|nr:MerR family DNA-binding protein [Specibacter cremeus]
MLKENGGNHHGHTDDHRRRREAHRTRGGHRLFDESDSRRLQFIRNTLVLGFGLDDIREKLVISDGGQMPCRRVRVMISQRIHGIDTT